MLELVQTLFAGFAQGSLYALIAIGFVVVYRATGVLNFTTGGLLMLGAYVAQHASTGLKLPFAVAVIAGTLVGGLIATLLQVVVLRRMQSRPAFTLIMVTWAMLIILEQIPPAIWGFDVIPMGDPWGIEMLALGPVNVFRVDAWAILATLTAVLLLVAFFRFTKLGLAARATASDPEAAVAQGIRTSTVYAIAWLLAGASAGMAGIFMGSGARVVSPELSLLALIAIPAVIVGGLESPTGAVLGGLLVGIAEVATANYAPVVAPWLGRNFHLVMPYLVLIAVLLLRPQGLLGARTIRKA